MMFQRKEVCVQAGKQETERQAGTRMSPCYTSGCWMTCWARPNPACKHNGGLMMWVRLMGGYHWRSCTAAGHRTLVSKYQEWKEGNDWVWSMVTMGTRGGEKSHPHTRKQWNTCSVAPYTPTHLKDKNPALRVDVCVVSCTHDSMEQILCVLCVTLCVFFFCGLIIQWCSSFTLGVIDTPV